MGERQVKIPQSLFIDLIKYFEYGDDSVYASICEALDKKQTSMINRVIYAESLTGDENARKEYLDRKGIKDDFRY